MITVKNGGVSCGVARSCKVGFGVIDVRHGPVVCGGVLSGTLRKGIIVLRSSVARSSLVMPGKVWSTVILEWFGLVRLCPVRLREAGCAFIDVLRGLLSHCTPWFGKLLSWWSEPRLGKVLHGSVCFYRGTVLSCPVRLSKASFSKLLLWFGGAVFGPDGSSGVLFGTAICYRGLVSSCSAGWCTLVRSLALQGKLLSRRGIVCNCEVLSGVVKYRPVKHCYVRSAKLLLWRGFGKVKRGLVRLLRARFYFGVVKQVSVVRAAVMRGTARFSSELLRSCEALLSIAWRSKAWSCGALFSEALSRRGQVWFGTVLWGDVWFGFAKRYFGYAMRCPVRLGQVKFGTALLWLGEVVPGEVSFGMVTRLQK